MISLIIPVFNESESLPKLLERICRLDIAHELEIIVLDDSDNELTVQAALSFQDRLHLTLVHRHGRHGLSASVLKGFDLARSDVLICLDGDGSHPVEKINALAQKIKAGESMVVASRHVLGGGVAQNWSKPRRWISNFCCFLTSPLTPLKDPMSGFFAISADFYQKVRSKTKPISYKIALELAVKGGLPHISEIPYTFETRKAGSSKVNFPVIAGMVYHILRLYTYRFFYKSTSL